MKIKQLPQDFHVEELTDAILPEPAALLSADPVSAAASDEALFALYRLEKTGWTTHDAVTALRRRWKVDARRVSFGGLKDRHAHTIQYLTVFRGPRRNLHHQRIAVTYLGQMGRPFSSDDIRANRFRLTLRHLTGDQVARAQKTLEEVQRDGVPNYFDDQRFGSVGSNKEFVARHMVRGDFDAALRLALAAPYEFDRAAQKKEKAILRRHWGDWAACKDRLPPGHVRKLVDDLRQHPHDLKGALDRLRPELRGLYLAAYQSFLWNRMLARWLRQHLRPEQLVDVRLKLEAVPMHHALDDAQRAALAALHLPLPSARMVLSPDDPRRPLVDAVLQEEGLTIEQMKLRGMKMFFSRGERAALCRPAELSAEAGDDELNAGRHTLTLRFDLPRGAYATILVKRLTRSELKRQPED